MRHNTAISTLSLSLSQVRRDRAARDAHPLPTALLGRARARRQGGRARRLGRHGRHRRARAQRRPLARRPALGRLVM